MNDLSKAQAAMEATPTPTLIENMIEQHGYPRLDREGVESFVAEHHECVLFFAENPARFPETNDVAMILPELIKEYRGRLHACVIATSVERELQSRYGFRTWPTLVFLRDGGYLGAISKVQNWGEYIEQINDILAGEVRANPGVGIPVAIDNGSKIPS